MIKNVNTEKGIELCGGTLAGYTEVLKSFCYHAKFQIEEMEAAYQRRDMAMLAGEAHALKSVARGIGAQQLGELAFALEQAGKRRDLSDIETHYHEVMKSYKEIAENIQETFLANKKENVEHTCIDNPTFINKLTELIKAAQSYDLESAGVIVESLREYEVEPDEQEGLARIHHAIQQFSYADTIKEAKALLVVLEEI